MLISIEIHYRFGSELEWSTTERDGNKVARQLRDAILRLQYRPGQNLDEAELSEALGVSRTPGARGDYSIGGGWVGRAGRPQSPGCAARFR